MAKKCLQCGEPVNTKGSFCSAECHEEYDLELETLFEDEEDFQAAPDFFDHD